MKSFTAIALSILLVFAVNLAGCFGEEDPLEPGEDVGIEDEWEDDDYEAEEDWDDDWEAEEDDFEDDWDDDWEDDF